MKVVLDFETCSLGCDLKLCGADRYAQDPNTEVLSLVYHVNNTYNLWTPATAASDDLLRRLAADPSVKFVSHASFEQAIWRWIMVPVFGFAPIPISRWSDTQAACALHALPLDLDHALIVLGLPVVKDLEGRKVTLDLSKISKKTGMLPAKTPEIMEKVYDYNRIDVVGTVHLHDALGELPDCERKVWEIDQAINQRGIKIDLPFVRAAKRLVKDGTSPLVQEFREITGLNPTQGAKFLQWLGDKGVELPNLKKETVAAILGEDDEADPADELSELGTLPEDARRALDIRALVGSSSLKKLDRMEACVGFDGRARGLLQYHAAATGRWAGRILQPQNFPRGSDVEGGTVEEKISAVLAGDRAAILHGFTRAGRPCDPLELVVASLRHALLAGDGCTFIAGDYAGIEARIVLALAGQHDKTELMAKGLSPYCDVAGLIYGRPIDKYKDPIEYTIGKNTFLGCGFQMGWQTYQKRYCPNESDEFAKAGIDTYRKAFAPLVPRLWKGLEDAALAAVHNPGRAFWSHGIGYKIKPVGGKDFMVCRLLDGKCIYYFDPRPCMKRMPWSTPEKEDIRPAWKYRSKKQGAWIWVDAYGGILTENVVQALARQLLCRAMERLEAAGWPIVLTVHDEIMCEVPDNGEYTEDRLKEIMCAPVEWAEQIKVPINVETWQSTRYKK